MELSPSLLALAIFSNSRKPEYVRSIHLYVDQHTGSVSSFQQEFLLHPGAYSRISQPLMPSACFRSFTPAGLSQFVNALKQMQQSDGWQCVLEYRSDRPGETTIVALLNPSRNAELNSLPSLAHDLRLVEEAAASYPSSSVAGIKDIGRPDTICHAGEQSTLKNSQCVPTDSSIFSGETFSDQLNHIPGLETPDRTPQGMQSDLWHAWGSDLELASPRISEDFELGSRRASFADSNQATLGSSSPVSASFVSENATDPALWSLSLLGSNSQAPTDFPSAEQSDFALQLPNPIRVDNLNLELGTSASLQNSGLTEVDAEIDRFSLDCFGLEGLNCNLSENDREEQAALSLCSDASIGSRPKDERVGKLLALNHVLPSQVIIENEESANSPTTSGGSDRVKIYGTQFQETSDSPATSSDHNWTSRAARLERRSTQISRQNSEGHSQHRGTSERITEITLNELSQYFHMPITQASKELKVGLTVLKKRCREFGIPRWPHRKMKSLDSLISNIQDLAKEQGVKWSEQLRTAVRELEEQKKAMEEMPGLELAERTKRLRQACFKASYKKRRITTSSLQQLDQLTSNYDNIINPSKLDHNLICNQPHSANHQKSHRHRLGLPSVQNLTT